MKTNKLFMIVIAVVLLLMVIGGGLYIYLNNFSDNTENLGFKTDFVFFKLSLETNKTLASQLKITNNENFKKHFSLNIIDMGSINELVSLKESEFDIERKGEKTIEIDYDSKGVEPGVYTGQLRIVSGNEERLIPIILEVQSNDILFDSNINLYPQGDVVLGQKINAEMKIFDLSNIGKSNVNIAYSVKNFEGMVIVSEANNLVVDGKLDYSKTIDIPSNIKEGKYVFYAVVTYKDSVGTSSTFFDVVKKQKIAVGDQSLIFWIILLFGFFFFVFLSLFFYSLIYRDKLIEELHSDYKREIKRQRELIMCKQKSDYSRLKDSRELKEYKREVKKIKQQRIKALKQIHKERIKQYKRIKKTGNKNKLNLQVNKWKKQGYETGMLEKKYKLPDVNEIKKKVDKWKKQGYDTSVLVKK